MESLLKTPMAAGKQRIEWIDTAKAIGICTVVIGHSVLPVSLRVWIYSFHMPLFFFLTGMTFKFTDTKTFFKKRAFSLLFPYFLFSFAYLLKDIAAYFIIHDGSIDFLIKEFIGIFVYIQRSDYKVNGLWFLPCLFLSETIFFFVIKLIKTKKKIGGGGSNPRYVHRFLCS